DEPVLLIRRNERFTGVRSAIVNDVLESPVDNLVTQRPVRRWEPIPSRAQPTPRRTADIRRSREEIGSLQPASLLLNGYEPSLKGVRQAGLAGFEPATHRLTAGCSAD